MRSQIRVMVVEDEPDFRHLLVSLLGASDWYVVHAADVADWLDDACSTCPDILLLDLILHGTDALEHVPRVVASCPRTMVAALTARSAEDYERAVLAAGAFVFHEKEGVDELPGLLAHDYALFQQALAGKEVLAPSAVTRRTQRRSHRVVSTAN